MSTTKEKINSSLIKIITNKTNMKTKTKLLEIEKIYHTLPHWKGFRSFCSAKHPKCFKKEVFFIL